MGSIHSIACKCGFNSEVTIGGGRMTFRENSMFPFYCATCGLVEMNIAPYADDVVVLQCPQCKKDKATQYGVPPASLIDMRPKKKKFRFPWQKKEPESQTREAVRWGTRVASEEGHKCPSCLAMTLKISPFSSIMFD